MWRRSGKAGFRRKVDSRMKHPIAAAILVSVGISAAAAQTPDVNESKLANGLDVAVVENHASPFVRIDLVFRAGAIAQGAANAGAFHTLEHALLAAPGPGGSAEDGLKALGVPDWKAETADDYMSFDLKLPSDRLADGLGVWAAIMGRDSFDQQTTDAAKARAIAEAAAQPGDPQAVFEGAMVKRVYSRFPWRRDPVGDEKAIQALTPEALGKLKKIWLVPSNALLIIAGDVDPTIALSDATTAFAGWKAAPSPWNGTFVAQPKLGVMRPTWFAMADSRLPEGLAMAEVRYRGPDLGTDPKGAFVADVWADLAAAPDGRFEKNMAAAVPDLHGPVLVQFLSQRDASVISVSGAFDLDGKLTAMRSAEALKEGFRATEVIDMKTDPNYFSAAELDAAKARIVAARQSSIDSIDGIDAELRFSWASTGGLDWYRGWEASIGAVSREDTASLVNDWILHNLEVVALRMNPTDFAKESAALESGGFELATPDNSFWWRTR